MKTPEWLPFKENFPVIALINDGINGTDARLEYLSSAVTAIPNSFMKQHSMAGYINSPILKSFCVAFSIVDNSDQLKVASELIFFSTSVILDLSAYSGDVFSSVQDLQASASDVPISFLVSVEQIAQLKSLLVFVRTIDVKPLFLQEFSLSGCPAAYLDLLEHHIYHSPRKKKIGVSQHLAKVGDICSSWKRRFNTLSTFIKWRFGLRRF